MKAKIIIRTVAIFLALTIVTTLPVEACILWGCSPGFWKNRGLRVEFWSVDSIDNLGKYFMFPNSLSMYEEDTLLDALKYKGGKGVEGAARILLRAAAAALLNAYAFEKISETDDGYFYSAEEVIELVNTALASENRVDMISIAEELDDYNNEYCPF